MKKLLAFLGMLVMYHITCAQTTIANNLQLVSGKGAPAQQVMPVNGGLAYVDVNGMIKKADFRSLLGKKVDSLQKINDSTIRMVSQWGNTYDIVLRGLYDLSTKGFVDSLRGGQVNDTSIIVNQGAGIRILSTSTTKDTVKGKTFKANLVIAPRLNADSSFSAQLLASGVTPGPYGDNTHVAQIQVDSTGRVIAASSIAISGAGGGVAARKTLNAQTGSSYTVVATDSSTYITVNNASTNTLLIPDDGTATIPVPTFIDVYQTGAGKIVISPLNGTVVVNSPRGEFKTFHQYSKIILNKIAANTWILSGDLDTAVSAFITASVGSLTAFSSTSGSPSSSQSFTVTGSNLTANGTVTAPSGFEVSLDNSSFASTKSITQGSGVFTGQPITVYTRLAAADAVGSYSGSVTITSTGASSASVAVTGSVANSSGTVVLKGTSSAIASLTLDLSPYYTTYDYFRILIYGVTPATNGSDLLLTVSPDASTFNSASYSWKWENGFSNNGSNSSSSITLVNTVQNTAHSQLSGEFVITGTNNSALWPATQNSFYYINSSGNPIGLGGSGYLGVQQITKALKLAFSSGNIATITYKVVGYNN